MTFDRGSIVRLQGSKNNMLVVRDMGEKVVVVFCESPLDGGLRLKELAAKELQQFVVAAIPSLPAAANDEFNDPEARKRFFARYNADKADAMSEEEWGRWVDKLPKDEFLAMICLDTRP
jgi:hypothetical protein